MHIELTPEDEALLQEQVSKGHFASFEEAFTETLHRGMSSVFSDAEAAPPAADYLVYLNEAIEEGLADADANRTVPVEEVRALLQSHYVHEAAA